MNKESKKQINSAKIVSLAALVSALAALALVLLIMIRMPEGERATLNTLSRDAARHSRLEFCYNRQIIPCDEENLHKWNSAHQDDTFNLEAYRNSQKL